MRRIAIIGAGGFARELRWLLSEIAADPNHRGEAFEFAGFVVSDVNKRGDHDSEIAGGYEWLEDHHIDAVALGIGTPAARLRVAAELQSRMPHLDWPTIIHPSVRFDRSTCTFGKGAVICAGVIATVNVAFEQLCLAGVACTIGHESRIGAGTVLNPASNVSGGVDVGRGVLIGTGAQILQYLTIGEGATVGAGAVVSKNVDPWTTVVGVPAKPLVRSAAK